MSGVFSGAGQWVAWGSVLDGYDWRTQAWTMGGWVKTSIAASYGSVVGNEINAGSYAGWDMFVEGATGRIWAQWVQTTAANKLVQARSNAAYNDGAWHHVVWTLAAKVPTLYVDGAAVATTLVQAGATMDGSSTSTAKLTTGARNNGSAFPFPGQLDDVRVHNRALSANEIRSWYTTRGRVVPRLGLLFAPDPNTAAVGAALAPRDRGPSKFTATVTGAPTVGAGPLARIRRG